MIAYVAIFAVMVNLCLGVFVRSSRMSALGTGILDRMHTLREIRREFAESVMAADAVVPAIGGYRSGADTLVLRMSATEGTPRYAVFGRFGGVPRLSRLVIEEHDGRIEIVRAFAYPLDLDVITFTYGAESPEQARLVSLHVDIHDASGKNTAPPGHTYQAALRGRGAVPASEGPP